MRDFFNALFWIAMTIFLVRVWHLVAPPFMIWLSDKQKSDIDTLIFAALGGAALFLADKILQ